MDCSKRINDFRHLSARGAPVFGPGASTGDPLDLQLGDLLAHLAHYQDGLRVLDLSDPTRPRPVAWANTWTYAGARGRSFYEGAVGLDVDPATRRIYVADSERGLLIYEERK